MKRFKYLALATLVGAWACSSDAPTETPVTGTISGTVTIEGSGASGITVSLSSGASATTDGSGAYAFTGVQGGAYTVTISDYPSDVSFSSTSKAAAIQTAGQTVPVDFSGSYIRTSSIVGTVAASGTGIAGVSVEATGPGGTQNKVTDANGNFAMTGLRAGNYTVAISDIPEGYTFTTTSKSVTVGVGATEQAQFAGTKDLADVTATVLIQSVTKTNTNTPVNPAAVAGQIDVTLAIEPGSNQLSKVCVLLDGEEVPNGCQTLSSAVAGDGPQAAATFEPVFTILTHSYDASTGAPAWLNENHTLSAVVDLTNAAQSSVETNMQLTFANADMVVATVEPEFSAVGGDDGAAPGKLWYGGDQMVHLLPVLYSGKTLASASVQFSGNGSSKTAESFPGDVTFTSVCGSKPGPLCGYQSGDIDEDEFFISSALYEGGTSATSLVGTHASGPNGMTHNIDEVAPVPTDLYLTDQVADWQDGVACCSNNWVGEDYAFADGLDDDPADAGVGIGGVLFYVGDPADDDDEIEDAGNVAETAGEAGLALSFTNAENTVVAVFADKVGNKSYQRLQGSGNNGATTFGFDNTMPTSFKITGQADQSIFNITSADGTGLTASAVEDRAGFSSRPLSAYLVLYQPGEDPFYAVAQDDEDGGAVNISGTIPACGADPSNANICNPVLSTLTNGLWMWDLVDQDQAGNRTETHVQRWVLVDDEAPETQNVSLPPQVVANSSVTYSAPVTDNHDLWSVAFGQDFGDLVYIPFGENVMLGDGNRWNTDFTTSGTATMTLDKAIVARQMTDAAGAPTGAFAKAANVRAIATDAAGNQSLPFANNFIPSTVDPTNKAANFTMDSWIVTGPDAAVELCNGQSTTECDPDTQETSVTMEMVATGASGTFANPFGSAGKIYVYINIDTGGGFYSDTAVWYLLGSVNAASAALTDDGAHRQYTWEFTVSSADVADFADGTSINLVAMGLNAATGTLLVSQPNANVTVVDGS